MLKNNGLIVLVAFRFPPNESCAFKACKQSEISLSELANVLLPNKISQLGQRTPGRLSQG
jgi:hypothetical protein